MRFLPRSIIGDHHCRRQRARLRRLRRQERLHRGNRLRRPERHRRGNRLHRGCRRHGIRRRRRSLRLKVRGSVPGKREEASSFWPEVNRSAAHSCRREAVDTRDWPAVHIRGRPVVADNRARPQPEEAGSRGSAACGNPLREECTAAAAGSLHVRVCAGLCADQRDNPVFQSRSGAAGELRRLSRPHLRVPLRR